MDPFNKLTPAEAERLALLAEECSEVIQAVGKILRHGYESTNPTVFRGPTNRAALERELGDVGAAIAFLLAAGDVNGLRIEDFAAQKLKRVRIFLHHQEPA
jgi:NTP pyrophosphatase (non-canonical NTP hydrolase)